MRRIYQTLSWLSLAAAILPAVLFLAGQMSLETSKTILLIATIGWFVHTPLWMGRPASST